MKSANHKPRRNGSNRQERQIATPAASEEQPIVVGPKPRGMPANLKYNTPTIRKPYQLLDLDNEESWLRLRSESGKAYSAFCIYRDMEPEKRSFTLVSKQLRKSTVLLGRWSRMWAWQDRILAWDRHMDRVRLEADARSQAKEIVEMNKRQAKLGLVMQGKAAAGLQTLKPEGMNAHQMARLGRDGAWIERIAMGAPTEVRETSVEGQVEVTHSGKVLHAHLDLTKLTNDELNAYYLLTEKASIDPSEPEPDQS